MRVRLRLAQYVPLAYRRQPKLPARYAKLHRNCEEACVRFQIGVHLTGRCPYRILRRRGAFTFLLSFRHHNIYRTTLPQRGIDVLVVCCFLSVRGIRARIERNVLIQEIDTLGHTAVISQSHPEHVACAKAVPWAVYANEPPAGQLRLA
jgi:hypothetical protein